MSERLLEEICYLGFFKGFLVHLLGFANCFIRLSLTVVFRKNLVEATVASLESKIEHANCFFQVKRAWNADKFNVGRQLVHCNERDHFAGSTDEEISWPRFAFLMNANWKF
jgi:hypothetical protein